MFVTTAGRTNKTMELRAQRIAEELEIVYVPRKKQSIAKLQEGLQDSCIVVGKERLELFMIHEADPFFFHPNSSMFRIKRLLKGDHDPMIDAMGLKKGMSVLDGTLGLGSDSIVASFVVGSEGRVVGVEANPYLRFLVCEGLTSWQSGNEEMDGAMRRIDARSGHSLEYMRGLASHSFDVVYLDPMFEETILASDGIRGLSRLAWYEEITHELVLEARRIASKRLVLKDHFRSVRFERFGFEVIKRPSAKFHFGYITV